MAHHAQQQAAKDDRGDRAQQKCLKDGGDFELLIPKEERPQRQPMQREGSGTTAVTASPGIPSASIGTSAPPVTALLAVSAAATPSGAPLPNPAGSSDRARAK